VVSPGVERGPYPMTTPFNFEPQSGDLVLTALILALSAPLLWYAMAAFLLSL